MERIDAVVVGAGVIGLAVARALALTGREVVVIEAASSVGTATSSRHSEVIHAGLYYPAGSLKTRLCVAGRALLYAYCESRGIPFKRCGKLLVATTEDEVPQLMALSSRARDNGVEDLQLLSSAEVASLEPAVRCHAAMFSPSSGIVDSHSLMVTLQGELERACGTIAFRTAVVDGSITSDSVILRTSGDAAIEIEAGVVVNAAGLGAQTLARSISGLPPHSIPPLYLAKGNYFELQARPPFSHLVYPVPVAGGLGIHATIDLAGRVRFGPDIEWVDAVDYKVDPRRVDAFYAAIREYWPGLPDGTLAPAYSGIRPKVERPGGSQTDFVIHRYPLGGTACLINLFGIESPGLTSCLALADYVAGLVNVA